MQCLKEGFITRGIDEPGFTSTNVHNTFLGEDFYYPFKYDGAQRTSWGNKF